ncbi:unnamed protein product [Amoebophrya sp. A25]|nr:unnamed protein product [Amoebophrya sp. A25]|eukprot:GSA25T00011192001.1
MFFAGGMSAPSVTDLDVVMGEHRGSPSTSRADGDSASRETTSPASAIAAPAASSGTALSTGAGIAGHQETHRSVGEGVLGGEATISSKMELTTADDVDTSFSSTTSRTTPENAPSSGAGRSSSDHKNDVGNSRDRCSTNNPFDSSSDVCVKEALQQLGEYEVSSTSPSPTPSTTSSSTNNQTTLFNMFPGAPSICKEDVQRFCNTYGFNAAAVAELLRLPDGAIEVISAHESFHRLILSREHNNSTAFVTKIIHRTLLGLPLAASGDTATAGAKNVSLEQHSKSLSSNIATCGSDKNDNVVILDCRSPTTSTTRTGAADLDEAGKTKPIDYESLQGVWDEFARNCAAARFARDHLNNIPEPLRVRFYQAEPIKRTYIMRQWIRENRRNPRDVLEMLELTDCVSLFVSVHDLSVEAARALRATSESQQWSILRDCVIDRCAQSSHDIQQSNGAPFSSIQGHLMSPKSQEEVAAKKSAHVLRLAAKMAQHPLQREEELLRRTEQFFEEHNIDESARRIFYSAPSEVQWAVLEEGPLIDARNNNAVLVKRVNSLSSKFNRGHQGSSSHNGGSGFGGNHQEIKDTSSHQVLHPPAHSKAGPPGPRNSGYTSSDSRNAFVNGPPGRSSQHYPAHAEQQQHLPGMGNAGPYNQHWSGPPQSGAINRGGGPNARSSWAYHGQHAPQHHGSNMMKDQFHPNNLPSSGNGFSIFDNLPNSKSPACTSPVTGSMNRRSSIRQCGSGFLGGNHNTFGGPGNGGGFAGALSQLNQQGSSSAPWDRPVHQQRRGSRDSVSTFVPPGRFSWNDTRHSGTSTSANTHLPNQHAGVGDGNQRGNGGGRSMSVSPPSNRSSFFAGMQSSDDIIGGNNGGPSSFQMNISHQHHQSSNNNNNKNSMNTNAANLLNCLLNQSQSSSKMPAPLLPSFGNNGTGSNSSFFGGNHGMNQLQSSQPHQVPSTTSTSTSNFLDELLGEIKSPPSSSLDTNMGIMETSSQSMKGAAGNSDDDGGLNYLMNWLTTGKP